MNYFSRSKHVQFLHDHFSLQHNHQKLIFLQYYPVILRICFYSILERVFFFSAGLK